MEVVICQVRPAMHRQLASGSFPSSRDAYGNSGTPNQAIRIPSPSTMYNTLYTLDRVGEEMQVLEASAARLLSSTVGTWSIGKNRATTSCPSSRANTQTSMCRPISPCGNGCSRRHPPLRHSIAKSRTKSRTSNSLATSMPAPRSASHGDRFATMPPTSPPHSSTSMAFAHSRPCPSSVETPSGTPSPCSPLFA